MADLVTWISDVMAIELGTIGTTDVTVGLMTTASLLFSLALSVLRKIKGRG